MKKTTVLSPGISIALFLGILLAVFLIGHLVVNKSIKVVGYMSFVRHDYGDFFKASENMLNGDSPYDDPHNSKYVTSPVPAVFNMILVPFGFEIAGILNLIFTIVAIGSGYWLVVSRFGFLKVYKNEVLGAGLACLLFGYPFYFLIERGNIDGWVFLWMSLGLFFLEKNNKAWVSGFFFALASVFKIYPLVFFIPLLLEKKWKSFIWGIIWIFLFFLLFFPVFIEFRQVIMWRAQDVFALDSNGSLVATVTFLLTMLNSTGISPSYDLALFSPIIAALLFAVSLSLMIYADYKFAKKRKFVLPSVMMYIPFMVALPKVVYLYSFIILILLIPVIYQLWLDAGKVYEKKLVAFLTFGVILTQWQVFAMANLTENIYTNIIPGFGLMIIIGSFTVLKLRLLSSPANWTGEEL